MKKICPTCHKEFTEVDNFCTHCGIELVKESNKCSEMKMALCKSKTYKDDDRYCSICGAPTVYWKSHLETAKSW